MTCKSIWESSSKTNISWAISLVINIVGINFMSKYITGGKIDLIFMILIAIIVVVEQKFIFKSVVSKQMIFWSIILAFHMICNFYFFYLLLNSMSLNGYFEIGVEEIAILPVTITFFAVGSVCVFWRLFYTNRFKAIQKTKIFNIVFLVFTLILIGFFIHNFGIAKELSNFKIVTLCMLSLSTFLFFLYYNIFAFSLKFTEIGQYKAKVETLSKEMEALAEEEILLEKSIRIDGLTRVYTKKYMMKTLDSICNDYDKPFVVFFADLNKLKEINDAYGHSIGDEYLKTGAEIIKSNFREVDYVGRVGGDEILVICNDLEERVAEIIIERIMTNFYQRSSIERIELSASIGFVKVTKEMAEKGSLHVLELADRAMRNQKTKYYESEGEVK